MLARSVLAAIDHNYHLYREQVRNAEGELVFSRRWSKRAKRWKVVIAKEKENYSYLLVMCATVLKDAGREFMKKKSVSSKENPKNVAPTIASLPAPPTSELAKEHLSRF